MGGKGSKSQQTITKQIVSTTKKNGTECDTFQGEGGCWQNYLVTDTEVTTTEGDGDDSSERIVAQVVSPYSNLFNDENSSLIINGIDSNLHPDLEGSILSIKEGFKEGGPGTEAARKINAKTARAIQQVESTASGATQNVQRMEGQALGQISGSIRTASNAAGKAITQSQTSQRNAEKTKRHEEQSRKNKELTDNHEDIAREERRQARIHKINTRTADRGAQQEMQTATQLTQGAQVMNDEIQDLHGEALKAATDAKDTSERTKALHIDMVNRTKDQQNDDQVNLGPQSQGSNDVKMKFIGQGMKASDLAKEQYQTDETGKALKRTLSAFGLGDDISTFVGSRTKGGGNKIEPFSLLEGFKEGNTGEPIVTNQDFKQLGADLITIIQNQRHVNDKRAEVNANNRLSQASNRIGELMHQRQSIAGDIYSDYLTSDKSSNVHDVYQRKQENIVKERLVQTKQYEMNIYNEYINLGKIVVIAFVLFVLAKVLNNKGILGDSMTELFTALVIILTIIFIIWKLVWLGLRDPIDFNKTNQGYDRQYVKNMEGNKYAPKKYNLGFLSGTCSGEDCCSSGMTYNPERNRCVKADGFDNIVGSPINGSSNLLEGFQSKDKNTVINDVLGSL